MNECTCHSYVHLRLSCSYNLDVLCIGFVWVALDVRNMLKEQADMSQLRTLVSLLLLQFGS